MPIFLLLLHQLSRHREALSSGYHPLRHRHISSYNFLKFIFKEVGLIFLQRVKNDEDTANDDCDIKTMVVADNIQDVPKRKVLYEWTWLWH